MREEDQAAVIDTTNGQEWPCIIITITIITIIFIIIYWFIFAILDPVYILNFSVIFLFFIYVLFFLLQHMPHNIIRVK